MENHQNTIKGQNHQIKGTEEDLEEIHDKTHRKYFQYKCNIKFFKPREREIH